MLGGLGGVGSRGGLAGVEGGALGSSAARSVLGRSAATSGIPTDIVATADDTFLGRIGGVLAWAPVTHPNITSTWVVRGGDTGVLTGGWSHTFDPTTNQLKVEASVSGTLLTGILVNNSSPTATSAARIKVMVGNGATGDVMHSLQVSGGAAWTYGIDNSAADRFALTPADGTADATLGTGDVWQAYVTGSFAIGNAAVATTATDGFLYVTTCPGIPTGAPTAITGRAAVVVDSTNNRLNFYAGGAWRALTDDTISKQTLGGDSPELSFTFAGITDERVVIRGRGRCGENGSVIVKINNDATPCTYTGWLGQDGGNAAETTYLMTAMDAGDFGFTIIADIGGPGSKRGGTCTMWALRDADGVRNLVSSMFGWANTADEVQTFKLVGNAADFFKQGFKVSAHRQKIGA